MLLARYARCAATNRFYMCVTVHSLNNLTKKTYRCNKNISDYFLCHFFVICHLSSVINYATDS